MTLTGALSNKGVFKGVEIHGVNLQAAGRRHPEAPAAGVALLGVEVQLARVVLDLAPTPSTTGDSHSEGTGSKRAET
jgi:hypothetical protein